MINLALAELFFAILILIIAYLICRTINGYFQAWLTNLLGDSSAKELGFMSLNPLSHVDLFSFVVLIFLGIGCFQTIPIDPYSFIGSWRYVKLALAYGAEVISSITVAILALLASVALFGFGLTTQLIITLFSYYTKIFMMFFTTVSHLQIASIFTQQQSPLVIVSAFILTTIVYLMIWIATFSLIFNLFRYFLAVGFERGYSYIQYAEHLSLFGPVLVMYVFGDKLLYFLLQLTLWGAVAFGSILGVFHG